VPQALAILKKAGYLLIVITNQAGIAKGLYTAKEVLACHQKLQAACGNLLDALYYCPYHPEYDSESLLRKPDSLMLEKAMAKYTIDPLQSWMVGDRHRDIEAAQKVNVRSVLIVHGEGAHPADFIAGNLWEAANIIVKQ
jgi:D-glycero-D-manno-heptose 1,7-bisphosphate phosphatase